MHHVNYKLRQILHLKDITEEFYKTIYASIVNITLLTSSFDNGRNIELKHHISDNKSNGSQSGAILFAKVLDTEK